MAAAAAMAFNAYTRLLMVAPHPDDETLAAGILLQRVLAAGGAADVLLLTSGGNNPWPQRVLEHRLRIDAAAQARWAARRQREIHAALACLGVPGEHLHALDWPDMGLLDCLLQSDGAAVTTLRGWLLRLRPSLLVLPALSDRHPDHSAAHVLLRLALAGIAEPPIVWTYLIHAAAVGQARVDVGGTTAQREAKLAALAAHASQTALSGGRLRRLGRAAECFAELVPTSTDGLLPWRPPALLQPLLWLSVVDAHGAQSWRWPQAPLQRCGEGGYRLAASREGSGPRFARLGLRIPSPWIFDHWGWCEIG
jgi:LmbE family N-acetylglucosaminyl deacetylase